MASAQLQKRPAQSVDVATQNKQRLRGILTALAPDYVDMLGGKESCDRLMSAFFLEARINPKLMEAAMQDPASVLSALKDCADWNLVPGKARGHVYLIPYKGRVQAQAGYRGYIVAARRSGAIASIETGLVYEGDFFKYERGLRSQLRHIEKATSRTDDKLTHVWALTTYTNGGKEFVVLDRERIAYHRRFAKQDGTWSENYAEMARKSAILELRKTWPHDEELARIVESDAPEDPIENIADAIAGPPPITGNKQIDAAMQVYEQESEPTDEQRREFMEKELNG